jgi:hypothetical protein
LHYESIMHKQKRRLGLSRETIHDLGKRPLGINGGLPTTGMSCAKCSLSDIQDYHSFDPGCGVPTCSCNPLCARQ